MIVITKIILGILIYIVLCLTITPFIENTLLEMNGKLKQNKKGYFSFRNYFVTCFIIDEYLIGKKEITLIIFAPLIWLYLLGCKLGFVIFKIRIKGSYKKRIAPWLKSYYE